jgi:hypothetical protein
VPDDGTAATAAEAADATKRVAAANAAKLVRIFMVASVNWQSRLYNEVSTDGVRPGLRKAARRVVARPEIAADLDSRRNLFP